MVSFFLLFKPDLFALFLPNTPQPCIRSYRFVYIKSIANHFSGIQCSEHWSKGVLSLTSTVLKGKTLWEKNLPMNFVVCCCKRKTNFLNLPSLFPQVWKWWRQLLASRYYIKFQLFRVWPTHSVSNFLHRFSKSRLLLHLLHSIRKIF